MSSNNIKEELNIDNLSKYLNINNLSSNEQINLNQNYISYYKTQPNYPIILMQIIINNDNKPNINSDIKLNASIQLKNFIKNYWKFSEQKNNNNFNNNINNDIIIINENIKKNIKENIIDIILYSITNNEKK